MRTARKLTNDELHELHGLMVRWDHGEALSHAEDWRRALLLARLMLSSVERARHACKTDASPEVRWGGAMLRQIRAHGRALNRSVWRRAPRVAERRLQHSARTVAGGGGGPPPRSTASALASLFMPGTSSVAGFFIGKEAPIRV